MSQNGLASENIWLDKSRYDDAERAFHEKRSGHEVSQSQASSGGKSCGKGAGGDSGSSDNRVDKLQAENLELKQVVADLQSRVSKLEIRLNALDTTKPAATAVKAPEVKQAPKTSKPAADDDDDDVDLFGSEDDEEADALRQKRLDDYAAKKSKKPALVAKSSVVLDVKPWDDETDMVQVEVEVRKIVMDGLFWGASKLVPLAYGIKKLQIVTVIEDDKVSVEELTEKIEGLEDLVQSVDVAAFNKI